MKFIAEVYCDPDAVGRIDARTSAIRAVGISIIGSYQKGD
jgi:hypothetical protein